MGDEAARLIALLIGRRLTIATCESITGGGIGAALTSVAGSSSAYRGGLVTYATDLKTSLAGVDPLDIATFGVVSGEVALGMARGCRAACSSDWGIGVTGVAGPAAVDDTAPGTAWLAVVGTGVSKTKLLLRLHDDRALVRESVVRAALAFAVEVVAAE